MLEDFSSKSQRGFKVHRGRRHKEFETLREEEHEPINLSLQSEDRDHNVSLVDDGNFSTSSPGVS